MERRVDEEVCAIDEDKRRVWSEPSNDGVNSRTAIHVDGGAMIRNLNQDNSPGRCIVDYSGCVFDSHRVGTLNKCPPGK
jgi:hypothetical protein